MVQPWMLIIKPTSWTDREQVSILSNKSVSIIVNMTAWFIVPSVLSVDWKPGLDITQNLKFAECTKPNVLKVISILDGEKSLGSYYLYVCHWKDIIFYRWPSFFLPVNEYGLGNLLVERNVKILRTRAILMSWLCLKNYVRHIKLLKTNKIQN